MDRDYLERNREASTRLRSLIDRLSIDDLNREVEHGWTVSAVLAHLAHWDRMGIEMIDEWDRSGRVSTLPGGSADAVNAANLELWQSMDPRQAAADAIAIAALIDERIVSLPAKSTEQILAAGRPRLDRSHHRFEHIEQIERATSR